MFSNGRSLYSRLLCRGIRTTPCQLSVLRPPTEVLLIPPSIRPPGPLERVAERPPSSNNQWKRKTGEHQRMNNGLSRLQKALRANHRRMVRWPTQESEALQTTSKGYLEALMQPVVDMFNHLSRPDRIPIECKRLELDGAVEAMTFLYGRGSSKGLPIVLHLADNIFSVDGNLSDTAAKAVARALDVSDTISSVTISNFSDIAVCFPSIRNQPDHEFVEITTPDPLLGLRIVAAAGLCHALPVFSYLTMPDMELSVDEDLVLPQGPAQDPNSPLIDDADVFATHRKNSDFDRATLVRDRSRALQFFRWHKHMKQERGRYVARPGDILLATTNDNGILYSDFRRPLYPFESSRIPADTAAHLRNIQRVSPLGVWQEVLQKSKQFSVKIRDVLSEGSERSISSVYRCDIVDIDGTPIPRDSDLDPPSLCLKLFDDLYQDFEDPLQFDEELQKDENISRWFDIVQLPEWNALNEALAYEKLSPVQGSTVPWFYGVHQFKLGDGRNISGLLMEYVEGEALNSSFSKSLSEERKIHMIKSCRHAARILDIGDVSQRDWHQGQLLLCTDPTTGEDHVVLIDFASTTQTYEEHEPNYIGNYTALLTVLSGFGCESPFERILVWKHFGEPDDWHASESILCAPEGDFECQARNMFPFISVA